jgi:hypothetical protein
MSSGPIACQTLVRKEGTTSSAAACAGDHAFHEASEHEDRRDGGKHEGRHAPHIAGAARNRTSDVAN